MEGFVKDYNEFRIRESEHNAYNTGRATVLLEHINILMNKQNLSLEEACNALGISVHDYKDAEDILNQ